MIMIKIILTVIEFIPELYFAQINFYSFYLLFSLSLFVVVLLIGYQIVFAHGKLYNYGCM